MSRLIRLLEPRLNIIRRNLVLWCDGYFQTSYPGSASTWTDISGFGNHLNHAVGFGTSIVWDAATKSFVYNPETGKTRRAFVAGDEYDIQTIKQCTIEMWVKLDTLQRLNGLFSFGNMYGSLGEIQYQSFFSGNATDYNIQFVAYGSNTAESHGGITYSSGTYLIGKPININQWVQVSISWNNQNTNIYIDGIASVVEPIGAPIVGNLMIPNTTNRQLNVCSRRLTNVGQLDGNCAIVRFYTIALSQEEIQHNYNMTKGRFGL